MGIGMLIMGAAMFVFSGDNYRGSVTILLVAQLMSEAETLNSEEIGWGLVWSNYVEHITFIQWLIPAVEHTPPICSNKLQFLVTLKLQQLKELGQKVNQTYKGKFNHNLIRITNH